MEGGLFQKQTLFSVGAHYCLATSQESFVQHGSVVQTKARITGGWLFGRLPVEVLFVCLCVRLGGMHHAIAMVRRSVERVELHRA